MGLYFREGVIFVWVVTIQSTLHVLKSIIMKLYPADINAAHRVCSASSSALAFNATAASVSQGYIPVGCGLNRLHAQATRALCTALQVVRMHCIILHSENLHHVGSTKR